MVYPKIWTLLSGCQKGSGAPPCRARGSAKFSNLHKRGDYICDKVEAKTLAGAYDVPKVMMYNTKTQLSTIVDGSGISMEMTDGMKTDLDHACSPGGT